MENLSVSPGTRAGPRLKQIGDSETPAHLYRSSMNSISCNLERPSGGNVGRHAVKMVDRHMPEFAQQHTTFPARQNYSNNYTKYCLITNTYITILLLRDTGKKPHCTAVIRWYGYLAVARAAHSTTRPMLGGCLSIARLTLDLRRDTLS